MVCQKGSTEETCNNCTNKPRTSTSHEQGCFLLTEIDFVITCFKLNDLTYFEHDIDDHKTVTQTSWEIP